MQQDVTKCTFCLAVLSGSTLRRTPVSIGSTLKLRTSQMNIIKQNKSFLSLKYFSSITITVLLQDAFRKDLLGIN